ncbi:unnamed protein product (macronuclear) [Paramecium tetraurelia]|uniref:Uncharacterized protein n=1 Tax=Paramecium tetraurelia TaxID=5888 RepID=A0EDX0_PARTE|nr:uncharacterized protein GSPATT00025831001 [Paramecium tetraurelia]CAK93487.1 unnamed protein product [Paramecium tetraurelia]|eukprot:XP_001460884.1 hypothetical protein (macronuclear) [Paramecium tetraurelia strain d4-2]
MLPQIKQNNQKPQKPEKVKSAFKLPKLEEYFYKARLLQDQNQKALEEMVSIKRYLMKFKS